MVFTKKVMCTVSKMSIGSNFFKSGETRVGNYDSISTVHCILRSSFVSSGYSDHLLLAK
jgi:hypothetical protein